jgi:hypothetical protein
MVKVKVMFALEQATKAQSSTLSLTSAIDVVGGQCHTPADFPPEILGTHCIGSWKGPRTDKGLVEENNF